MRSASFEDSFRSLGDSFEDAPGGLEVSGLLEVSDGDLRLDGSVNSVDVRGHSASGFDGSSASLRSPTHAGAGSGRRRQGGDAVDGSLGASAESLGGPGEESLIESVDGTDDLDLGFDFVAEVEPGRRPNE
jgi:hypothetical protein